VTSAGIAPMLSVRRGAEAVAFYKAAFGARELFKIEAPDGAVVAQLAVDTAKFWVADESPAHLNFSPEKLAAGAKQIWPVREEHGWLMGRVVDPYGHHWEIGKPLRPGVGE